MNKLRYLFLTLFLFGTCLLPASAQLTGAEYFSNSNSESVGPLPNSSAFIQPMTVTAKTTSFSASINTYYTVNNPSANVTVTLPDATTSGYVGQPIGLFFQGNSATKEILFATASSQTIGQYAASTWNLSYAGESLVVISDGTNWQIAANNQYINLANIHSSPSSNTAGSVFGVLNPGSGGTGAANAVGGVGHILIANSSAQYIDSQLTSSNSTITVTESSGGLNVDVTAPLSPAYGGLGTTTAPTNGQIPIGSTSSGLYAPATITAGAGIGVTNGASAITIANQLIQASETSSFTASAGYFYQVTSLSGGNVVVTPPSASANTGKYFAVQLIGGGSGSNHVSFGSGTTNYAYLWNDYDFILWISDGTTWQVASYVNGASTNNYSNGQLLIGDATHHTYQATTLAAGPGISITNGVGSITINNISSGLTINSTPFTSNQTLNGSEDNVLTFNVTSSSLTATLPQSSANPNKTYWFPIIETSGSTHAGHTLTITAYSGDSIQSGQVGESTSTSFSFTASSGPVGVVADGAGSWYFLSSAFLNQASSAGESVLLTDQYGNPYFGGLGSAHSILLSEAGGGLGNISPTSTSGIPVVSAGSSSDPVFGTVTVAGGGLGITTTPSNGQLPIGNGTNYTDAALTAGAGIGVTNGSGSITINNQYIVQTKTNTNFTAAPGYEYLVNLTSGGGSYTATLPDATTCAGQSILIVLQNGSGTNYLPFATTSSQTINGGGVENLAVPYTWYQFISDGSNWETFNTQIRNTDGTITISYSGGTGNGLPVISVNPSQINLQSLGGLLTPALGGTGFNNTSANGHILIGNSTTGYEDGQLGSSDSTITWTKGAGTLTGQVDQGNLSLSSIGGSLDLTSQVGSSILPAANGGLGIDANGASNGFLPIGNGTNFTLASLSNGSGINIGNTSGAITITAQLTQVSKTSSFTAAVGNFYQINDNGGNVTVTMPSASGVSGQSFAAQLTTVNGSLNTDVHFSGYQPNLYNVNDFIMFTSDGSQWNVSSYVPGGLTSGIANGQLLIGNGTYNTLNLATLTAGSNKIGITNGAGSITIDVNQANLTLSSIGGSVTASQLPNPSASTLGGIESLAATSHQWINTISTSGVPSSTQPAFSDISGTLGTGAGGTNQTSFSDSAYVVSNSSGTTLTSLTGSNNTLAGFNSSGVPVNVTIGTGLTLSGNSLTASGGGGSNFGVTAKNSNSTLTSSITNFVTSNPSSSNITLVLPAANTMGSYGPITFEYTGTGTGTTILQTNQTNQDTFDGAVYTQEITLTTAGQTVTLESDGGNPGNWRTVTPLIVGNGTPITAAPGTIFGNWSSSTATPTENGSGTTGQVPTVQSSGAIAFATPSGFGGNGADGAISNPSSYTAPIQKNATTFSLTGSNTLTVGTANTANTGCPTIINATGTFTLGDGTNASTITIAVGSGAAGGVDVASAEYNTGGSGAGPGGGANGSSMYSANGTGAGGGGFGGAGGHGGLSTSGDPGSNGGQTYSTWLSGGSAGGHGGNDVGGGNTGGTGGNAGASLVICAVGAINCEANSVINCKGGTGANAGGSFCGGGGGGSGGLVLLASQTSVTIAGTINVSGGAGGTSSSAGGGGGGGSGRIIAWSPSNSTGSATFTMSGGSGGTGGGQSGASGGSGSEQSITGTPNLPLLTWINTNEGNNSLCLLEQLGVHNINQRTLANFAGHGSLERTCYYNMGDMQGSTCMGVGDVEKVESFSHVS